jgi:hypothetical protein
VLEPVVAKSAILVSDGAQAYQAFAFYAGLPHIALNLSAGERTRGIYHIQNVNHYGSRLKTWMRRFNGVATKYLDSYLGWCAFRGRRPLVPAHGDHLFQAMATSVARGCLRAPSSG